MTAMTTVQTVAGTTLSISAGQPATLDAAGYGATSIAYTLVGEIEDLGSYGAVYGMASHIAVSGRTVQKRKTHVDYGKLSLKLGRVPADAGQVIALAASASDTSYTFKVTYPQGTGTTSEIHYFQAQAMSWIIENGTADNIQKAGMDVEVTTPIIIVAAT